MLGPCETGLADFATGFDWLDNNSMKITKNPTLASKEKVKTFKAHYRIEATATLTPVKRKYAEVDAQ